MKSLIYIVCLLAAALGCTASAAQTLNSAYFTDAFATRHTLNPAYADEDNYFAIPLLGDINIGMRGNIGYEDIIVDNPMYPSKSGKTKTTFMNPYVSDADALEPFSSSNRVMGNVNIALLSAGFKALKGYNTIELNSRSSFGMKLPYGLFAFARNTGNERYDIGDISVQALSFVELAFGHSRRLSDRLRLGGKAKVLFGVARADLTMEGVTADLSGTDSWTISGQAVADVSMKGFSYTSETKEYRQEKRGSYNHVSGASIDGKGLAGLGLAFDLGAVYSVTKDITVSMALLDLGFISWNNDIRAVNKETSFTFSGFHDVSVADGSENKLSKESDNYADQLSDFANLTDQGDRGGRTTGIGATLNIGAAYTLPAYRKISFGLLSATHFQGDYSYNEERLSVNWAPLRWLDGGVNIAVGSFTAMGWVMNIHSRGCNFFIGMDHIIGKMSKEMIPLSSNADLAMGMSIVW